MANVCEFHECPGRSLIDPRVRIKSFKVLSIKWLQC